jgi:hypothetical protein
MSAAIFGFLGSERIARILHCVPSPLCAVSSTVGRVMRRTRQSEVSCSWLCRRAGEGGGNSRRGRFGRQLEGLVEPRVVDLDGDAVRPLVPARGNADAVAGAVGEPLSGCVVVGLMPFLLDQRMCIASCRFANGFVFMTNGRYARGQALLETGALRATGSTGKPSQALLKEAASGVGVHELA